MITKDELDSSVSEVIDGVRNPPTLMLFLPSLPVTKRRFDGLLDRCVDLQKKLRKVEEESEELLDLQKEFFAVETDFKKSRARLMLIPSVLALYFGSSKPLRGS